ncbi:periplasmic component of the Tol biopolymer transport system [Anaerolinea thermolimosa]|uniref:TolB family protein n=1 Tax=Anaerolinea thermolimosa TaxID=229919 RepID=UPI0007802955|nr:TolB family protein [Anaerolinea thermolimosa]GAP06436.1 periplasmic component of the Tol biopolymer transport system [Anaerolinea thermolimosa]
MRRLRLLFSVLAGWLVVTTLACGLFSPSVITPSALVTSPAQPARDLTTPEPIPTPEAVVSLPLSEPSLTPERDEPALVEHCPDNLGSIVFSYDPGDHDSVRYGIYRMNADGGNRVRLSDELARTDTMPAWSPERCQVAYVRFTEEGHEDIFLMFADGSGIRRLTTSPAREIFPDWSPDGRQISFISDQDGSRNLYVMNADGTNQHQLTDKSSLARADGGYVQWQQWSPDGEEIAFTFNPGKGQGTGIYVIHPDGSGLREIAPGGHEPAWSPDGSKIYFLSNETGQVEIWVVNRDGSGRRQISHLMGTLFIDHSLRVSPDGTQLAFYGTGPEVTRVGTEIYVLGADGQNLRNISHAEGQDEWLDW